MITLTDEMFQSRKNLDGIGSNKIYVFNNNWLCSCYILSVQFLLHGSGYYYYGPRNLG